MSNLPRRSQSAARVGRGEPAVEARSGCTASGQACIAGGGCKEIGEPAVAKQAGAVVGSEVAVSERGARGPDADPSGQHRN